MQATGRHTVLRSLVAVLATTGLLVGLVAVPSGASTSAKPKGDPVKVMVIYEGSVGIANPELPEGAEAAAKALNKKDGIGGHPVEVIVCDTNDDPNTAADCGRQAIEEGVVALVGVLSPHSGSFMPLMVENGIPSIGLILASADDFQSAASFPLSGGIIATSFSLPVFLAEDGAKSISVARPDLAAGAILGILGNTALEPFGQTMTNDVPVPTDAPDMSTYVQAALAGGSDAIIVALPGQQAINFVQAAKQADPNVKLAMISTEPGPVSEALGADAAGIIQSTPTLSPGIAKTSEGKRFTKELKAAKITDTSGFRLNSWLSMQVLAQLADGLPEITGPALTEKLSATTGLETGLTPPLQWTTPADVGISIVSRVFNTCVIELKLTKKGTSKATTGTFFDAVTGQDCPAP